MEHPRQERKSIFPVTLNGDMYVTVRKGATPCEVVKTMRTALRILGARRIEWDCGRLRFRSSLFRLMSGTNLLAPISYCEMRITGQADGVNIQYHISLWQLFVAGTIGFAVLVGIPLFSAPNLSSWQALGILVGAWLFLMGGNWVLTALRFPRFVRACASGASNEKHSS